MLEGLLTKEVIGLVAALLGFFGAGIYILSILRGHTKPHLYTHVIWVIISGIALAAQLHDKAGPGAWTMAISFLACIINVALSLKYGEKNITKSDKIALASALIAIVPWLLTDDPLMSVILICCIDVVAFYPTYRKAWHKPYEENLSSYYIANLRHLFALMAMAAYTWNTLLFVITAFTVNSVFIVTNHIRRGKFKRAINHG